MFKKSKTKDHLIECDCTWTYL